MKARVKETGELVEVHTCDDADFQDRKGNYYWEHQLYFGTLDDFDNDEPDYWTRLEHQYAGMAMQGLMTILPNIGGLEGRTPKDEIIDIATETAHALVQKMKEERK